MEKIGIIIYARTSSKRFPKKVLKITGQPALSTLKSDLTVGPPIDIAVYKKDQKKLSYL